ncbi:MAG: SDR family oxidoreductase [Gemmatimonadaceae bacterium]
MILAGKVAIIYGAGSIGGAVAREFAREGAIVYLAGRTQSKLDIVANDIRSFGGQAHVAELDARDQSAVTAHADRVVAQAGRIDVMLNALGEYHVQGRLLTEMSLEQFMSSIDFHMKTHYTTAKAVVDHMTKQRSGVVLTITTPGGRLSGPGFIGNGAASGAIEAFSRCLAGELGPSGIRVICLRPDAMPETLAQSYVGPMFSEIAARNGTTAEAILEGRARATSLIQRSPRLAEVAAYAAFVASDKAGSMTGAIANLTGGTVVD